MTDDAESREIRKQKRIERRRLRAKRRAGETLTPEEHAWWLKSREERFGTREKAQEIGTDVSSASALHTNIQLGKEEDLFGTDLDAFGEGQDEDNDNFFASSSSEDESDDDDTIFTAPLPTREEEETKLARAALAGCTIDPEAEKEVEQLRSQQQSDTLLLSSTLSDLVQLDTLHQEQPLSPSSTISSVSLTDSSAVATDALLSLLQTGGDQEDPLAKTGFSMDAFIQDQSSQLKEDRGLFD